VKPAVFLDRDGVLAREIVINGEALAPLRVEDFVIVDEAAAQVERLHRAGFRCVVFTNQPEVAKGLLPPEFLQEMHRRLTEETAADDIMVCPHVDADGCACRKPQPGMLLEAAQRADLDLSASFVVGDRWRDVDAGKSVGCYSILIERPYSNCSTADARVPDLTSAVDVILARSGAQSSMTFIDRYLDEVAAVAARLDRQAIERTVELLTDVRMRGGRLFIVGVGGSAGNASHAVNDFRKIAHIEAYTPTDNVSELTARINDDGWDTSFANWLSGSKIGADDALCVLSVGGGDAERGVSVNLIRAIETAKAVGARVFGIVGRDGGFTARNADVCVVVPPISADTVTAHSESFQAVVWHLLVSHPSLQAAPMKWESLER